MSYCKEDGKDQVIFATKEDLGEPSKAIINVAEDEEDHQPGLILPNGDINWECPCLGGMATGPCGVEFRDAFSCFHYSEAEPKGSDCYDAFVTMQHCMGHYPELYPPAKAPEEEAKPDMALMNNPDDIIDDDDDVDDIDDDDDDDLVGSAPASSSEQSKVASSSS